MIELGAGSVYTDIAIKQSLGQRWVMRVGVVGNTPLQVGELTLAKQWPNTIKVSTVEVGVGPTLALQLHTNCCRSNDGPTHDCRLQYI